MEKPPRAQSAAGNFSLVFGIFALMMALSFYRKFPLGLTVLLPALAGIISGFIGVGKQKTGRLPAAAGIILNLVALAFTFMCFVKMVDEHNRNMYRRARRISCTSNLKQIGLALKQYAMDYNDAFPPLDGAAGLELLRSDDYLTDYGVYVCPQSVKTEGSGTVKLSTANVSYIYFGGFREGSDNIHGMPDTPLAFDNPGNDKEYIIVLFQDGHVQAFPSAAKNCKEVVEFLNKTNKYPLEHYKILKSKAVKADAEWGLP